MVWIFQNSMLFIIFTLPILLSLHLLSTYFYTPGTTPYKNSTKNLFAITDQKISQIKKPNNPFTQQHNRFRDLNKVQQRIDYNNRILNSRHIE